MSWLGRFRSRGIAAPGTVRRHLDDVDDPVEVAAVETTVYPDAVSFLDGPTGEHGRAKVPHGVAKWVLKGEAQFRYFAHQARLAVRDLSAAAFGLTARAEDQTRRRDALRASADRVRAHVEHVEFVLGPYQQHHGRGETVRYVLTWLLLIAGDTASGTLVLVYGGEHPAYAGLMMVALGAAAVTTGLLAKDLKRHHLWLAIHERLPDDLGDADLVRRTFTAGDRAWRFAQRIMVVAVVAGLLAALGVLMFRLAVDSPAAGIAYFTWSVAIGASSWWSAWTHCDPAGTAVRNARHQADRAQRAYEQAPDDAITERARHLAAIAETLADYENRAWAAWYTMLAAAAEYLRSNPALAGQGTDGTSYLHTYAPSGADLFGRLADEFQVPGPGSPRRLVAYRVPAEPSSGGRGGADVRHLHEPVARGPGLQVADGPTAVDGTTDGDDDETLERAR